MPHQLSGTAFHLNVTNDLTSITTFKSGLKLIYTVELSVTNRRGRSATAIRQTYL
jgi:hypothetical protein